MFFNFKNKRIWENFRKKKLSRSLKALNRKRRSRNYKLKLRIQEKKLKNAGVPCIKAPEVLALAPSVLNKKETQNGGSEHTRFVRFKNELWRAAQEVSEKGINKLMISFAETRYLYADACILLIATIDSLQHQYKSLKFLLKRPDKTLNKYKPRKEKHIAFNVDAVFCHVGLYKLMGFDYKTNSTQRNVTSWHYILSNEVDGTLTTPIFKELEKMGLKNSSDLYSGVIEGIANAVEHAYNPMIESDRVFSVHRWWMLVAELDGNLMLYVCDLGHGIPNTLRFNKDQSLLAAIFEKVKNMGSTDCKDIKASTLIKETRTKLSHRGKGGQDIKTFIEKTANSAMTIYSNRGTYRYNNQTSKVREILYDNELSISGTLLHWIVPIGKTE